MTAETVAPLVVSAASASSGVVTFLAVRRAQARKDRRLRAPDPRTSDPRTIERLEWETGPWPGDDDYGSDVPRGPWRGAAQPTEVRDVPGERITFYGEPKAGKTHGMVDFDHVTGYLEVEGAAQPSKPQHLNNAHAIIKDMYNGPSQADIDNDWKIKAQDALVAKLLREGASTREISNAIELQHRELDRQLDAMKRAHGLRKQSR